MTGHDRERIVAFLAGDLSGAEAEAIDEHLLECRECWQSVHEHTTGRCAAESLREVASAELRDRVRLAVSLTAENRPPRRVRKHMVAAIAIAATIAAATLTASTVHAPQGRSDSLAFIVHEVRAATADHTIPTSIAIGGRHLRVEEYDIDGGRVVVAFDTQPFPMPNDAHTADAQINAPWSAPVEGLSVLCFNEPRPALLVGDKTVSIASLNGLAHRLALD